MSVQDTGFEKDEVFNCIHIRRYVLPPLSPVMYSVGRLDVRGLVRTAVYAWSLPWGLVVICPPITEGMYCLGSI